MKITSYIFDIFLLTVIGLLLGFIFGIDRRFAREKELEIQRQKMVNSYNIFTSTKETRIQDFILFRSTCEPIKLK